MRPLGDQTWERSLRNFITRQKNAAAVANKLEKDAGLPARLPELVITHSWSHLHPKSKLIHFAKSSAVPYFACWWTAAPRFSLQSSERPQKQKVAAFEGARGL